MPMTARSSRGQSGSLPVAGLCRRAGLLRRGLVPGYDVGALGDDRNGGVVVAGDAVGDGLVDRLDRVHTGDAQVLGVQAGRVELDLPDTHGLKSVSYTHLTLPTN